MKAEPAIQRQLLDLADVDAELGRIEHRRRNLPEHAEITAAEQSVREKTDARVSIQTQLGDLERDIKRQEKDIEAVREREDRDRKLMDSGSVSSRQMSDVQHELETLKRRQSALEDDLLELMEQREAVEANAEFAKSELAAAEETLGEAQRRRDDALADLDSAESRRQAERTELVAALPEELLTQYERLRKNKGIGAALLRSRKCGACRLELDRSAISRIAAAPPDEVLICDECGTILVRTPESGL